MCSVIDSVLYGSRTADHVLCEAKIANVLDRRIHVNQANEKTALDLKDLKNMAGRVLRSNAAKGGLIGAGAGATGSVLWDALGARKKTTDRSTALGRALRATLYGGAAGAAIGGGADLVRSGMKTTEVPKPVTPWKRGLGAATVGTGGALLTAALLKGRARARAMNNAMSGIRTGLRGLEDTRPLHLALNKKVPSYDTLVPDIFTLNGKPKGLMDKLLGRSKATATLLRRLKGVETANDATGNTLDLKKVYDIIDEAVPKTKAPWGARGNLGAGGVAGLVGAATVDRE